MSPVIPQDAVQYIIIILLFSSILSWYLLYRAAKTAKNHAIRLNAQSKTLRAMKILVDGVYDRSVEVEEQISTITELLMADQESDDDGAESEEADEDESHPTSEHEDEVGPSLRSGY